MPLDPARLPGLHEAQERLETENILAAGLGEDLGLATREWEGGLWTARCRKAPRVEPRNQITGMQEDGLEALGPVLEWFDALGGDVYLRWPGPALDADAGAALAALGFVAHELEAWMAAPIESLNVAAAPHDIRELREEADVAAFGEAFLGGWRVHDPAKQALALAALAPWPGPPAWRRYTAFIEGVPAGEAILAQFGDVAYLADAATVPRFRRRGVQRALIARRIADARAAGAQHVFGAVQYGDQSWANMRALGLREAFMTLRFRRPGRL
ncbi:MAG: hypothetical protein H6741_18270 [Alphaproteobacteria bacterium]|nr:hypothetical protein [Alphaproteobacteria bacterium]